MNEKAQPIHPILPRDVRNILVILPSWVGDACMATPVLRHLAQHRPSARIATFGRTNLRPLMDGLPWINSFHPGAMRGTKALGELRNIRAEHFDAVLLLPNSFRSAAFARLTGITHRAGTDRDGRGWLLNHRFAQEKSLQSAATAYASLASWWTGVPLVDQHIELHVTEQDRSAAQILLRESLENPTDTTAPVRDIILLNPGANREDKRWPADHFVRAARELSLVRPAGDPPRPIAVNGGPAEAALCAEIAEKSGGIDLCARGVMLGSLKAILERTALLLTNDTGPRHIAAALQTPTIALFGPTDCRWTPTDYPHERRLLSEPFLTEDRIADDHSTLCAIDRISVGDVMHAAQTLDQSLAAHERSRISR
ncbi:MAG: glycosyltransferase family 9 protein [Planctomycetota bacterium]|nr:glycosyltransferase family 9 protein [Planctomycetota bacterium]